MRGRLIAVALVAMLTALPAAGAVTFGSVQSSGGSQGAATRTVAAPAGIAAGHFLLAAVATDEGDRVTITPPSGWTTLGRTDNGDRIGLGVYWKVAGASEPSSYVWSFSRNTKTSIGITRYIDVLTASPFDGTPTGATANGASIVVPGMTTTTANARAVAFVASATSTTIAPASGMTERYDVNGAVTVESADVVVPTAGATGAKTFTAAASARMVGGMVVLKKAPTPSVSLDRATSAAWEGNGTVRFWANLSLATQLPVTVAYTVAGSAGGSGVDHTLAAGTLSFAAGQTSKGINATLVNDALAEPNETLVVTLTTLANATAGAITSATHTIVNDDTTVGFGATASDAPESTAAQAVAVSLGVPSPREVTVTYTSAAGTASSGTDYAPASGTLTFPPWTTSRTIPLTIGADTLDEPDETFSLTLSAATNAVLSGSSHLVTILDDDATPRLDLAAATLGVGEGASPALSVALSAASGRTVVATYATSAGTAGIPGDVAAATGTLTFLPGETSKTIPLAPVQDALDETDETFSVTLASPQNATLGVATTVVTILDDDAPPLVRFATSASSGSESGTLVAPSVELSAPSALPVGVSVVLGGGTASAADFTGGVAGLSFAPGETTKPVPLAAMDDAVQEGDETIVLALSGPANATLGTPSSHVVTLLDDEAPVTVRFSQPEASAPESGGARLALVVLSGPAAAEIRVNYSWSGGTATSGDDYVASAGELVFAPGQTSLSVPFMLVDDDLVETDETIVLTLANASNALLASATHTFTILNDDAPYPVVSFASSAVTAVEGAAAQPIVVTLSAPSARVATVAYALGGTATQGADHDLVGGTLTFEPGETVKSIPYAVVDDAVVEPDETLVVTLGSPVRATLGTSVFTRTIANDDVAPPVASFLAATSSASETAPSITIRVQLDRAATSPASVAYQVTGGTATGDSVDYALPAGTLAFDAGESAEDIVVVLSDDLVVEAVETVVVALASPVGATLGPIVTHTLSIASDDVAPVTLAFAASSSAVSEGVGSVDLVVLASTTAPESYEVSYAATGGTASSATDFSLAAGTLHFEPGETSKVFTLQIAGDADHEPDESVVVTLSAPTYGALGSPATHVLTIQNDDAQPPTFTFQAASGSASESAGTIPIPVVLSPAATATATIAYAVSGGSATSGVDYTLSSGVLTFAAGETTKTLSLVLHDDATPEAGETVLVTLSNPTGALLGASEHVFTIANDDSVVPNVQWALAASTAGEGAGAATLQATLSASSTGAVTVAYSVTGGSATGGGVDFTLAAGTLTFAAGETTRTLSVPLVDDANVEGDETLVVTLASPTGATLGTQTAHTLTILENDAAATSLIEVVQTPVLSNGAPHTGATWGGWEAEPGATGVGSVNYLKLVNTGNVARPSVVVSFAPSGFVGRTDASFAIPTSGNLQFAWWEDTTPLSSAPSEGTFTFAPATASPSVTLTFTGTGRVIYVAYRIVQMPDVLLQQPYDGSFTVTEI